MQTVANAQGDTMIQTDINRKGVASLKAYHARIVDHQRGVAGEAGAGRHQQLESLLESLDFLVEAEARSRGKLVDLLLVSCYAARLLHAARTTSCKSAKDRTSVFHTLEVARIAERWGWIDR
jgi:hypothetical protein